MKEIKQRLKKYKKVLAEKRELELRIKEIDDDIGITSNGYEERTGQTYKINSITENQAIRIADIKDKLEKVISSKGIEVQRLENAMTVLSNLEKQVIDSLYIDGMSYETTAYKVDRSYKTIKAIEYQALKKIEEIIFQ